MKIKHITKVHGVQITVRKAYEPATLRVFGPVGALTQGGTMQLGEYNAANDSCPGQKSDPSMC